jgi:WD40 repeat protein
VASGHWSGTVQVWDAVTHKLLYRRQQGSGEDAAQPVRAVVFSPDGKTLATAPAAHGARGEVVLWEVSTGQPRGKVPGADCVAFSPDGHILAAAQGDSTIRLWDLTTNRELPGFKEHEGAVMALAFSSDGTRLASGSKDTTILVRDLPWRTAPPPRRTRP